MAEASSAIPVGVYPYLTIKGGDAAIKFYQRAFGAVEEYRNVADDGKRIMHARIHINGAAILLSDDFPEFRGGGRPRRRPSPSTSRPTNGGTARSTPAPKSRCPSPTSSGATATASSAPPSAIRGRSRRR